MKKIILLCILLLILGTSAYADNELSTTVENNNYLGIGQSRDVNHSQGEINSQLSPMSLPVTITPEYNGPVFKDHKVQDEILEFLLSNTGLHKFEIIGTSKFFSDTTETESKCILSEPLTMSKKVFVFKSKEGLKDYKYKVVGYIDTYSDGDEDETLMQCFNQAILDAGRMGANTILLMKINFVAGMKSSTIGLGSSGAGGFMHGGSGSSVYGAAIGYSSSTASTKTNPYIHGIALYIKSLEDK